MTYHPYPFIYQGQPQRIVFGTGKRFELKAEMDNLGCINPLIVCTPEQRQMVWNFANDAGCATTLFSDAAMHTPVQITEQAIRIVSQAKHDCVVAVGGGSAIGLSKALALRTDLPQLAIPTTYAGSEVTPIIGETDEGERRTQKTLKVLPEVVIYDAELTLSLPIDFSITSGINAIAHAVEALYAADRNPVVSLMAEEGIKALVSALPLIASNPANKLAREQAQYGAWLCGSCLGSVGMALHHKVCHVLGGTFGLPHAPTHTVMLPHALAYNAPAAPLAIEALGRIFEGDEPWVAIYDFILQLGGPLSLQKIGMKKADIGRAVELIVKNAYQNPRPFEPDLLTRMLERAHAGKKPVGEYGVAHAQLYR